MAPTGTVPGDEGRAMAEGLKLRHRCSYAVLWHRRHPDYDDVLA